MKPPCDEMLTIAPDLLRPHERQDGAGDRGETEHVGLEHGADFFVLALFDRRQIAVAGVVDEDVDAAEFLLRLIDDRRDLRRPVDVELQGQRARRVAGDEIGDLGGIARGRGDPVAAPDQNRRQLPPEAGRAAGDEPDGFVVGRIGHGDLAKGVCGGLGYCGMPARWRATHACCGIEGLIVSSIRHEQGDPHSTNPQRARCCIGGQIGGDSKELEDGRRPAGAGERARAHRKRKTAYREVASAPGPDSQTPGNRA